ncbi:DUF3177 family protein [Prochlorococcus marinus]|uniref:DUF3177 domain-containing protein n=1 Tax=Prochlorococcus marinus XMU1408 TaxID=2213228 RepID=A0A318R6A2_PROMR|nr:DUF3177 family protein [Prochlorococcus marinus]MBW3041298.1 DUF3177 domain-containing protein [Prochlorococcus marinus str. XMU1408]PYE03248.1 DUF3177 domain-containing protein [Prochlorococcus marinus XMU1408]
MTEPQFQILVWLSYRIAATFAFGLPLFLLIWAKITNSSAIDRLLSIYWKVSSLYAINLLFLSSESQVGQLLSLISPILMVGSIWFWVDLNEEIEEMYIYRPISLTTRIWRLTLSFWGILNTILHIFSWRCLNSINGIYCDTWREIPYDSFITTKIIIRFILDGNWTTVLSTFFGYLALILYLTGLFQWLIVQLPKNGRFAGKF